MPHIKMVDYLWILLMSITLGSAFIAESAEPGLLVTLTMALVIAIKGRIIVDHFMELKNANRLLRTLMRLYFYVIPAMVILVYLFQKEIVSLTTL